MLYDVVIVGGGASGLICALNAKFEGNKVLILEKNDEVGKKIKVTGNGRCNYYNDNQSSNCYNIDENHKDIILNQIKEIDIPNIFNKLGIEPLIKDGYYYPYSNKAITVRDALLNEVKNKDIEIKYNYIVSAIEKTDEVFTINNDIKCKYLVLATGGITYPITGSTGEGYEILKTFNHHITDLKPVLGKVYTNDTILKKLKGIRTHAKVSIIDKNISDEGELQLNDDSLSGICIFNISKHIDIKDTVCINFLPFTDDGISYLKERIKNLNTNLLDNLSRLLNKTLVEEILNKAGISYDTTELSDLDMIKLTKYLTEYKFEIVKLPTTDEGQVTSGGVSLEEINIDTYESKIVNNMFIIGELLDIDGICGGYNLTNAWNSGIRAGKHLKTLF